MCQIATLGCEKPRRRRHYKNGPRRQSGFAADAVKVVSRTCFGGKFCHFLHLQKDGQLVGRSSDQIAMADHPEPPHGSVSFG